MQIYFSGVSLIFTLVSKRLLRLESSLTWLNITFFQVWEQSKIILLFTYSNAASWEVTWLVNPLVNPPRTLFDNYCNFSAGPMNVLIFFHSKLIRRGQGKVPYLRYLDFVILKLTFYVWSIFFRLEILWKCYWNEI